MTHRISQFAYILALVLSTALLQRPSLSQSRPADEKRNATKLGAAESHFTVNGKPTFLIGISYFSALGASNDVVRKDLTEMKRLGFNWLRVWVTWNGYNNDISAVKGDGSSREPYLTKLKRLVEECSRRGLIADVTLSRGGGAPPHLATLKDLNHAVETVVTKLKPYENWYLDLANERNVGDSRFVSFEELKQLRATARRLAPALLVTASQGGDIGRDELREYLRTVQVDFICPHRPRDAESPAQTASRTREYLAWMQDIGCTVPINYQEPMRRGYGDWQPTAEDFSADLEAARTGGAAGWCFHNGSSRKARDEKPRRSFDLREGSLFQHLDEEEQKFLRSLLRSAQTAKELESTRK